MKARLRGLVEAEFEDEQEVAGLADRPESLPEGAWPAADHVAHYTAWRRTFLGHASELLAGRKPAAPPEDVDAENARHLGEDRKVPPKQLVLRWNVASHDILELLDRCSEMDLERAPEWFAARTLGMAILRNSLTHPRGHLIDFHLQRGRVGRAAELADGVAAIAHEFRDEDQRFPAGSLVYRGVAFNLRGEPDRAIQALRRAVELRPLVAPLLRQEASLGSLRGRPDFEELTAPKPPA